MYIDVYVCCMCVYGNLYPGGGGVWPFCLLELSMSRLEEEEDRWPFAQSTRKLPTYSPTLYRRLQEAMVYDI